MFFPILYYDLVRGLIVEEERRKKNTDNRGGEKRLNGRGKKGRGERTNMCFFNSKFYRELMTSKKKKSSEKLKKKRRSLKLLDTLQSKLTFGFVV